MHSLFLLFYLEPHLNHIKNYNWDNLLQFNVVIILKLKCILIPSSYWNFIKIIVDAISSKEILLKQKRLQT